MWSWLRYIILGLALLSGCTLRVQLVAPPLDDPAVTMWQQQMTHEINDHETRLQKIEKDVTHAE